MFVGAQSSSSSHHGKKANDDDVEDVVREVIRGSKPPQVGGWPAERLVHEVEGERLGEKEWYILEREGGDR